MAEKTAVTMEDGRVVEFGAKQKMIKTTDADNLTVSIDFANGKTLTYTVSDALANECAVHGASQKLGDEGSGIKEVDDVYLAIESLIARLDKGEWSKERTSTGMGGTSVLIQALVESSGKDVAVIKGFLQDKTQAQKLALRNNPSVKPIVERLEAEKLAAKLAKNPAAAIDTDALLSELA